MTREHLATATVAGTTLLATVGVAVWLLAHPGSDWIWLVAPGVGVFYSVEGVQKLSNRELPVDTGSYLHFRYMLTGVCLVFAFIPAVFSDATAMTRVILLGVAAVGALIVYAGTKDIRRSIADNKRSGDKVVTGDECADSR